MCFCYVLWKLRWYTYLFSCRFRIDNTDHIFDVNKGKNRLPHQNDRVNIICPRYHRSVPLKFTERFIIYNVNKEEYDSCHILRKPPRMIGICTEPYESRAITIHFRSFSPLPTGIDYKPGKDYYFISMNANGNGSTSNMPDSCQQSNMKLIFKVADPHNVSNKNKRVNHSAKDVTKSSHDDDSLAKGKSVEDKSQDSKSKKDLVKQEASTSNAAEKTCENLFAFVLFFMVSIQCTFKPY